MVLVKFEKKSEDIVQGGTPFAPNPLPPAATASVDRFGAG